MASPDELLGLTRVSVVGMGRIGTDAADALPTLWALLANPELASRAGEQELKEALGGQVGRHGKALP